ncbi:MAG: DNA methyltransferase [Candidatus Dormibacteria bacterium]
MNFLSIDAITISPDRQRREFDEGKLQELIASLQKKEIGLLHPIVVRNEGESLALVAGERRIRACKDIWLLGGTVYHEGKPLSPNTLPTTNLGEMSALDAAEAEWEENVRRVDLTWQEKALATKRLLDLRTQIAERDGTPSPRVADIAEEITGSRFGSFHENTRQDILLAKHLDDPEVKKAKTKADAVKILFKKDSRQTRERAAAELGKSFSSTSHNLYNEDSESWVKKIPPETFDVILTDPPYGMGADEFGDSGRSYGGHDYADSKENFLLLMEWLPGESYRIAKESSHLYLFCDLDYFHFLRDLFTRAGWRVFRTPLIWHKPSGYRAPWPGEGPQRRYETVLFAVKGRRKVTRMAGDVLSYSPDENLDHAAQKPVDLYYDLLSRSANPGDSVVDLFCGTGTIFPAAHKLRCYAVGVERDPGHFAIAANRLKGLS